MWEHSKHLQGAEQQPNIGDKARLQRAVDLSVDSGFQLDKEAFEFLTLVSSTENVTDLVERAITTLRSGEKKALFIDRALLEDLVKADAPAEDNAADGPDVSSQVSADLEKTGRKRPFRPYAKEVDSDLQVVEDPSTQIGSDGSIRDYLAYFRDRYERIERLLRLRIDARSAASIIDAFKASPKSRLKLIAMVTSKRESRGGTFLTIEDLHASTTVLVPRNCAEALRSKASLLLVDQVACFEVTKTGRALLIVKDVILPEVAQGSPHKATLPVHAALTSDLHAGSLKFQKTAFNRFILWLNGKYGNARMLETAEHVKYVLIAGDIVDGVGIYPNQIEELAVKDVHEQYALAASFIEQVPDYIEVVLIPGNHDASRKALPQPAIPDEFLETIQQSRRISSLGNPCVVSVHGVKILLFHGRSLEDVLSTVPGVTHDHPARAMTVLLKGRHLAPIYGGKTPLAPENRDFLVIDHVPDILHSGHIHRLECCSYRRALVVNSGCWQEQTEYMQRQGVVPTPGRVPVVNLQTLEPSVLSFN